MSDAPIVNIAAYHFVNLNDLEALREKMYQDLANCSIMGTILLAREGINLMLAGEANAIAEAKHYFNSLPEFAGMEYKDTYSSSIPFTRFKIKVKAEIVPMSIDGVTPVDGADAPRISAQELKQWLDEGRDFILLDTRNGYEFDIGSFETAEHYNIRHFRDFDAAAVEAMERQKDKTVVTFCTGGIRCEKAAPLLLKRGFKDVYQLDGGIIKYFQEVGGAHWRGDCFVFDFRTAITPECKETGLSQCERCQAFVTAEEQALTNYKRGEHCIHCMPQQQAA